MFTTCEDVPCVYMLLLRERERAVFELAETVVVPDLDECPDEERGSLDIASSSSASVRNVYTDFTHLLPVHNWFP